MAEIARRYQASHDWLAVPDGMAASELPAAWQRGRLARQRFELAAGAMRHSRSSEQAPVSLEMLIRLGEALLAAQPLSPQAHLLVADVIWDRTGGDREIARRLYARAIELNENLYLEPPAQLSDEAMIAARERAGEK